MGSVCCCFCAEDFEDWANPNSSSYRNCPCLRCLVNSFIYVYTSLSQREDLHSVRSSLQGAPSMTSSSLLDNSLSDTYHSPPRPSPYHSDQQGSSVPRHEKGSSYSNEETEPLRNGSDADSDSFSSGDKWKSSALLENSKEEHDKSSLKLSSEKSKTGLGYFYSSIEDEDVCPTCLEEYTSENPKIMTKCSHHFHLGCIYEWMERSDCCPVCGKVMIFDEKT